MSYNILFSISIAIVIASILLYGHRNIPITGDVIKLGDPTYDVKVAVTPVADGYLLKILDFILTKSILGPYLVKNMLNDNKVYMLRELASSITLPPLYFPMRRVTTDNTNKIANITNVLNSNNYLQLIKENKYSPNDVDIHHRTILDYALSFRNQSVLPSLVIERILNQIEAWKSTNFNIFSSINIDDVRLQAKQSDERFKKNLPLSILDGVPFSIKDMVSAKGHIIYHGSNPSDGGDASDTDDTIVERLKSFGAILVGLTIMVEAGVTPLGYNVHWKGPFNSYNISYYSGGSSSGSAVAVSSGLMPIAIGFDGGGSIRCPATMSGLHGLATTFGRIPFEANNDCSTLIKAGPLSNTALDSALIYAAISNNKENHFYTELYGGSGPPSPHLTSFNKIDDLSDIRLGIYRNWIDDSDEIVRRYTYMAIDYLKSKGATVIEINIPHLHLAALSHGLTITSEFASTLDKKYYSSKHTLESTTRISLAIGNAVTALELQSIAKIRSWLHHFVNDLFKRENLSAIVTPSISVLPPFLSNAAKVFGESNTALSVKVMKYASLANFIGIPGHSVPIGFDDETNLPIGLQLLGDHWQEHILLRLANCFDKGGFAGKKKIKPQYFIDPLQG